MPRNVPQLERWIEQHPVLARVYTVGLAILVCELALILSELTKRIQ